MEESGKAVEKLRMGLKNKQKDCIKGVKHLWDEKEHCFFHRNVRCQGFQEKVSCILSGQNQKKLLRNSIVMGVILGKRSRETTAKERQRQFCFGSKHCY